MSWLDAPKSEHIVRAEHFSAGWESGEEAERARISDLIKDELHNCRCEDAMQHLLTRIEEGN